MFLGIYLLFFVDVINVMHAQATGTIAAPIIKNDV
jgi:hypothetical protein